MENWKKNNIKNGDSAELHIIVCYKNADDIVTQDVLTRVRFSCSSCEQEISHGRSSQEGISKAQESAA